MYKGDRQPTDVRIRFVQTWGHPSLNLIMGVGDSAFVSRRVADSLIRAGYAVEVPNE
jgi:alpha-beta hydrolase superfamily lysophospholipase